MAGPCSSSACWRAARDAVPRDVGQVGAGLLRRCRRPRPGAAPRCPGTQIPPPDRAVEPPNVPAFSITSTLRPWCAAVSAAVRPAAPLPTTTTSNSACRCHPTSRPPILEHVPVLAEARAGVPAGPGHGGAGAARPGTSRRTSSWWASVPRAPAPRWRRRGRRGGGGPRPVRRRRRHGPVRRRGLRRRRHPPAAGRGRARLAGGDVRLPERRGGRRRLRGHAPGVLRRQPGHARLAGAARGPVRGQPVPGQDLLPDQPALPLLLRQRVVVRRDRAPGPAGAPDPRARDVGAAAVRPAGPRRSAAPAPGWCRRPWRSGWSSTRPGG